MLTQPIAPLSALLLAVSLHTGCGSPGTAPNHQPPTPDSAQEVQPLAAGQPAPAAALRRPDGSAVDMAALYRQGPSVVIFYRGGWCPYCDAHLMDIATAEPALLEMGYQVVAVSPDRPEELARTLDTSELNYTLLSDADMDLARAYGVAFRVDGATVKRYREHGIDLEEASGQTHHLLPVPAVFIVDDGAVIRFAHWDADYTRRLDADTLVTGARKALEQRANGR